MVSPGGLGERGSALWVSLGQVEGTPAGVLALEACRTADRLDELSSIIAGKGVLELMQFRRMDQHGDGSPECPVVIEVKFDNVLGEARQQQNALRQMLVSLGLKAESSSVAPAGRVPSSAVDEFTRRRTKRSVS